MAIRGPGLSSSVPTSLEGAPPQAQRAAPEPEQQDQAGGGRAASPARKWDREPASSAARARCAPSGWRGHLWAVPSGGWVVRRREACWVGSQQSARADFITRSRVNRARGGSRSHLRLRGRGGRTEQAEGGGSVLPQGPACCPTGGTRLRTVGFPVLTWKTGRRRAW